MSTSATTWAWPWWSFMVAINVVNLLILTILFRKSLKSEDSDSSYVKRMRIMGLIFALVGAYRSVFVSRYYTQTAWFDTIANSSLIVRSLAMTAELSFAGLFAVFMLKFNEILPDVKLTGIKGFINERSPYILFYSILAAQPFAYGGLILKSRFLFMIEEALWSLGFFAILPLSIMQYKRILMVKDERLEELIMMKKAALIVLAWCVIYCTYGLVFNVPSYWDDNIDLSFGKTGGNAFLDALTIMKVTHIYNDWGFGFLFWHSAYFSICVWISLYLMRAPRPMKDYINNKKQDLIILSVGLITLTILVFLII